MDLMQPILSKYEHDKNIFRKHRNEVFQKPWHSFRILSNVSMKYCSMNIKKRY